MRRKKIGGSGSEHASVIPTHTLRLIQNSLKPSVGALFALTVRDGEQLQVGTALVLGHDARDLPEGGKSTQGVAEVECLIPLGPEHKAHAPAIMSGWTGTSSPAR